LSFAPSLDPLKENIGKKREKNTEHCAECLISSVDDAIRNLSSSSIDLSVFGVSGIFSFAGFRGFSSVEIFSFNSLFF